LAIRTNSARRRRFRSPTSCGRTAPSWPSASFTWTSLLFAITCARRHHRPKKKSCSLPKWSGDGAAVRPWCWPRPRRSHAHAGLARGRSFPPEDRPSPLKEPTEDGPDRMQLGFMD
jgi:hypothetical protein